MSHYYDYSATTTMSSSPASSSSCSSLSRIRNHLHSHTLSQQRATKASDLACLLDPSYTHVSQQVSHTARHIYVDHDGEAHDPDFRLFNYSPRRCEFLSVDDEEDEDEKQSVYRDEGMDGEQDRRRRVSMESYYHRPTSRMSDPTYGYSTSKYAYDSYSYAVEDGYASPEEFDEPQSPSKSASKKLRRRRASHGDESTAQESESVSPQSTESHSPSTPSMSSDYSYTFRRSWHAFRLRTQVAAYRARKRMLGIVHVGSARSATI